MSSFLKILGYSIILSFSIGLVIAGPFNCNFDIVPRTDPPALPSDATVLSREERLLSDCAARNGAFCMKDRDGDGLVPALMITNFIPNYMCAMNGVPRGYIHVTNANQIGIDADDMDYRACFSR